VLIGDVHIGPRAYIGPCASLRGDFGRLFIGPGANVQDCCVMHGFPGSDTIIEEDGHIGHGAILHGCIVRRNGMVGMNAVVMDKAVVGESAIVAAQSFVKAGLEIPPRMLAGGVPAKVMRELTELEMNWKIEGTSVYHDLVRRCHGTHGGNRSPGGGRAGSQAPATAGPEDPQGNAAQRRLIGQGEPPAEDETPQESALALRRFSVACATACSQNCISSAARRATGWGGRSARPASVPRVRRP
jgi:phenylacetic acid degradation protein